VSIVRVGLAETKNFSDGYEAIFGKKTKAAAPAKKKPAKTTKTPKVKTAAPKKKKTVKKK
jgi:ribosomal protein L9